MASLYYGLLGVAARINETLRYNLINGLALNWGLLLAAALGLFISAVIAPEAMTETDSPAPAPVEEVLQPGRPPRRYVEVSGELHFEDKVVMTRTRAGQESFDSAIVPMRNARGDQALLVTFVAETPERMPRRATITGMLQDLRLEAKTLLRDQGVRAGAVPYRLDITLVAGERPWRLSGFLAFGVPSALILLIFGAAQRRGNVVFRRLPWAPVETVPSAWPAIKPIPRASGQFVLDRTDADRWTRFRDRWVSGTSRSRWFVEVPSRLVDPDTDRLVFGAYVDASLRFLGAIPLENRAGLWKLIIPRECLSDPEYGRVYLGLVRRPALRLRYRTGRIRRKRWAVLTFADDRACEAFLSQLGEVMGRVVRPV